MQRTADYKPALAWFAALGSAWVFVLVTLGALTTTIGAGMAFPDWPLSNGSVNPHGWLTEIDKFAEHSHRLSGVVMGLVTIGLAVWLHWRESRAWVRKLGWTALAIVIVQGLIGGKRVLLDSLAVPGFEMTLGQMLRIPHGVLAQIYVCVLFAIAASVSRSWIAGGIGYAGPRVKKLGLLCVGLLLLQLTVAVTMRHNHAPPSIGAFPEHGAPWLPVGWNYLIALQFVHRVIATAIAVAILVYGHFLAREQSLSVGVRAGSFLLVTLVATQIYLGIQTVWTGRSVTVTVGHVVMGALFLATTFLFVFLTHHPAADKPTRS